MDDVKIKVEGLSQLSRSLRKVGQDAPKGMRVALNGAADLLIDKTRPLIPRVTGAAARSLKAQSTRTSARVAVGGRKAPYYPWLDFGGQGRHAGRPTKRNFVKQGRYLYPTLGKIGPQIAERLDDALTGVARDAGLEVS